MTYAIDYRVLFAATLLLSLAVLWLGLGMQEPRKPPGDHLGRDVFPPLRKALPCKSRPR